MRFFEIHSRVIDCQSCIKPVAYAFKSISSILVIQKQWNYIMDDFCKGYMDGLDMMNNIWVYMVSALIIISDGILQ